MKRVHIREEVCVTCRRCEVYCTVEHSISRDIIKAYKKERPRLLARVRVQERGALSVPVLCRHCDEPSCVFACLTGALRKDPETGAVVLDREKCVGCWTCVLFCPHGAITPDPQRGVIAKCDLCSHLPVPACVANCPNEALIFAEEGVGG